MPTALPRSIDVPAASPPPCLCFTAPAVQPLFTAVHAPPVDYRPVLDLPPRHFSSWSKRRLSATPTAAPDVPSHGSPVAGESGRSPSSHASNVARSLATNARRLQRQLRRLAVRHGRHLNLGVAVVHLPSGQSANVRAGQQFPLASVAKLPLLFAAAHALHCSCPCHSTHHPHTPAAPFASCSSGSSNDWPPLRRLSPKSMLQVREEDKCIGSGLMRSLPSGMAVAVQQCLWLMNCISDNTAADLVFKAVGWPCVTGLLQAHGAHNTSVHLTQRQAFLLALGFSSELKEPYGTPRARRWQGMSVAQQRQMAERVEGESRAVSVRDLSAVEEASLLLQRAQGDKGYRNDSHIAAAMDNRGSPADMAGLLCKLTTARLLPWPRATALCLHTMAMQVYGQRRLPYYLPPALTVLHKTGSILGTVNAAGIIPLPRPPPALHSQHMRRHLTRLPLLPAVQASPRPSSPVTTLFSLPRSSAHLPGYEHAERGVGAESLQVSEGGAVVVAAFVDKVWRQHEREAEYVIARASKLAYDTWGERRRLRRMLSARERRRWMVGQ